MGSFFIKRMPVRGISFCEWQAFKKVTDKLSWAVPPALSGREGAVVSCFFSENEDTVCHSAWKETTLGQDQPVNDPLWTIVCSTHTPWGFRESLPILNYLGLKSEEWPVDREVYHNLYYPLYLLHASFLLHSNYLSSSEWETMRTCVRDQKAVGAAILTGCNQ